MSFSRRSLLHMAPRAAVAAAMSRAAIAQDAYPARPVRILVGYTAGGVSDILARLIGQALSERLGQPFVIEDRPGAASNVATEEVVRAAPDGYTLLAAGISNAINVSLYPDLHFSFVRDIAPVAIFSRGPLVMEVSPNFPAQTVPEFLSYARAHPGTIAMGSAGTGGATHVAGELFQMMTGVKFLHVPYRGSPQALSDLLGGRVQVMFDNLAASIALIRDGKLRPLAISARSAALPHLPLISDFVPGYEASVWIGLAAPKDTPAPIVDRLNAAVNAVTADPKFVEAVGNFGNSVITDTPAGFGRLIAEDTEKWAKVVAFAGIKPD